jgi:hypothetical protein
MSFFSFMVVLTFFVPSGDVSSFVSSTVSYWSTEA